MPHTFTTCLACSGEVDITETGQRTHPGCLRPHSHEDQLTAQYVAAVEADETHLADQLEHALTMLDAAPPRLADAALAYAAWGWPVFPLGVTSKIPLPQCRECKKAGCDGPQECGHELCHGCRDATTDPGTLRRWWVERPNSNIGLATGHVFDVLDVDTPAGIWSWADLRDSPTRPDIHGVASTPSGGLHVYLTPSGGGNMAKFLPGLDYRGVGGYVVAPPSTRSDGRYRWRIHPSPTLTRTEPVLGRIAA